MSPKGRKWTFINPMKKDYFGSDISWHSRGDVTDCFFFLIKSIGFKTLLLVGPET